MNSDTQRIIAEAVLAAKSAKKALERLPQEDQRVQHALGEVLQSIAHSQAALLALDMPKSQYAIRKAQTKRRWERYLASAAE